MQMKSLILIPRRSVIGIFALVLLLLSVPLVAMQFTNEVQWSFFDFVIMGALLTATGLICSVIWYRVKSQPRRIMLVLGVLFVFLLIWAELAVGIFS